MPSQPSPLQQRNEQRGAPKVPKALPKAPMSEAVAKRLLYHSTVRPLQRFDSADFFLDQHAKAREQEQEVQATADGAGDEVVQDAETLPGLPAAAGPHWQQQLQKPPPLPQRFGQQQK